LSQIRRTFDILHIHIPSPELQSFQPQNQLLFHWSFFHFSVGEPFPAHLGERREIETFDHQLPQHVRWPRVRQGQEVKREDIPGEYPSGE
jgi:hypothetical protein